MSSKVVRRALAVAAVLALVMLPSTRTAGALDSSTLKGRVLSADGVTPRVGVVISLVDDAGQRLYSSQPTTERGTFRIDSAMPGSYRLVAETGRDAFIAVERLDLEPGDHPALALMLKPTPEDPKPEADEQPGEEEAGAEKGQADPEKEGLPPLPESPPRLGKVTKWVFTGVIIVSAAGTYQIVTDNESRPSDF